MNSQIHHFNPETYTKRSLQNEKGILTLDFVFAFVIIMGFVGILFSFAMTFSVVEVVQYISFASARNYSLAHLEIVNQEKRAMAKYNELKSNRILAPLFTNGWFDLKNPKPGYLNEKNKYGEGSNDSNGIFDTFHGFRVEFDAPILYKNIPLLGATAKSSEDFTANIQSFLMREPTFNECRNDFINLRGRKMTDILKYPEKITEGYHKGMMDNGC